jgi:type IV secretion system protein VirB8
MSTKDEVTAPYMQAVRNNKILAICFVSSIALNILLVISFMFLLPMKEKVPYIIEFSSGTNNFVTVQKAGGVITNEKALISMFMRMYVVSREKIDHMTEEKIRYPRVMSMSSQEVRNKFKRVYGDKTNGLYYKKGLERKINIIRDSYLTSGLHQVEFETIDSYDFKKDVIQSWMATVQYTFSDRKVSYEERLLNPLGFFVLKYSIKRREK